MIEKTIPGNSSERCYLGVIHYLSFLISKFTEMRKKIPEIKIMKKYREPENQILLHTLTHPNYRLLNSTHVYSPLLTLVLPNSPLLTFLTPVHVYSPLLTSTHPYSRLLISTHFYSPLLTSTQPYSCLLTSTRPY